jgi:hypothetical protein
VNQPNIRLDPYLNDSAALNIAPLRKTVLDKGAEIYWDELLTGEYEWSRVGKQLRKKGLVK